MCRQPQLTILASLASPPGLRPMASLEELEARAQALRSALRSVSAEHSLLKRKAEVASGPPPPTPWVRSVALRVFALAESDFGVAVEYLGWKRRRGDADDVKAWFAALSPDGRCQLLAPLPSQPSAIRQLAEARKFMSERSLVRWVQRQNREKGIAPTPGAIVDQMAGVAGPAGRRSSRYKWLRRVSGRWGGRKCLFRVGDQLSDEIFRRKASGRSRGHTL